MFLFRVGCLATVNSFLSGALVFVKLLVLTGKVTVKGGISAVVGFQTR
jgi:hypothetical protein